MTTSPPIQDDEEVNLKQIIEETDVGVKENTDDQNEFNRLSQDGKLNRLTNLIEKSQIYSQIIADNILQSSLNKEVIPVEEENPEPKTKKRKTRPKRDITTMLTSKISKSTKSTREAIEKSQTAGTGNSKQPQLLTGGTLKDYQLDGLEWLTTLYENGLNGILADEMGLGKTIQCISLLCYLIENGVKGPFLIVVPVSTLSNWRNEINKFAPSVKVTTFYGTKQERQKINLTKEVKTSSIVLTSYETSIREFNKLYSVNWQYLIVDEGHRLKNSQCLLIKFLKKLNVSNRLLLTGTPLQNNLNELWSLLNFILPDIFHDLELFQQWFNFDELTNFASELDNDEETKQMIKLNIQETLVKNLHTILKPFILRRLKKDVVKTLPPKKEYLIHIPMTKLQKKLYLDELNGNLSSGLLETYLVEFLTHAHPSLFKNFDFAAFLKSKEETISKDTKRTTKGISYLELEESDLEEDEDDENSTTQDATLSYEDAIKQSQKTSNIKKKQTIIIESVYQELLKTIKHLKLSNSLTNQRFIIGSPLLYYHRFFTSNQDFQNMLVETSSKMQVLDQLLTTLTNKGHHKVLIFFQLISMIDLVSDYLTSKNHKFSRLDGSTSHPDRDEEIQRFNNDPEVQVFLLSTRAGGLGINLTAADTVILMDSDWNPQMDLQAIDRAHRIGQLKPVKIYRFVVKDSIEEILISRAGSKRFLERLVIQSGEFKFKNLNSKKLTTANVEDLNINEMMELSKVSFKNSKENDEDEDILLDKEEMDELLDRSEKCYQSSGDDSRFKKVKIFETVNNMDK